MDKSEFPDLMLHEKPLSVLLSKFLPPILYGCPLREVEKIQGTVRDYSGLVEENFLTPLKYFGYL